jgi:uncharacterized protein (UPF0276 family)
LDIGHARISAEMLGMDVYRYLAALPLERVVQVHTSGPRRHGERLVDAHEPLQKQDYAILSFVLERTQPQILTLEDIRKGEALQEQILHLRAIMDSHGKLS